MDPFGQTGLTNSVRQIGPPSKDGPWKIFLARNYASHYERRELAEHIHKFPSVLGGSVFRISAFSFSQLLTPNPFERFCP